jgi:O-antigen/teichoic acid export membrane protein
MLDKGNLTQTGFFQTFWRWAQFASGPTLISVFQSVLTLTGSIVVFRILLPSQVGQYALFLAIIQTLALLAGLGQHTLVRRLYALAPLGHFNWPKDLLQSIALFLPATGLACLILQPIYQFSIGVTLFILITTAGLITNTHLSHILSSQRHYRASTLFLRLPNNLVFASLLAIPWIADSDRLTYVCLSYLVCTVFTAGLAWLSLRWLARPGPVQISLTQRRQGVAFVVSGLAYQFPEEGLFSLAGLFLKADVLAAVGALVVFTRPFGVLYDALNQILLTELARRANFKYQQMTLALWALSGGLALGLILVVPTVSHVLYNGRYDFYNYLVPFLIGGYALQLAEVLARSHVNARASTLVLNRFIFIHTIIVIIGAVATIGMMIRFGALGFALGIVALYLVRTFASYYLSWQLKQGRLSEAVSP